MAYQELIKKLVDSGTLKSPTLINAFQTVDRQHFVPPEFHGLEDVDAPLPLSAGQTISQPTTVAIMLELLDPQPGQKILDIGSGSGWTTALLATVTGDTGRVFGVDIIPELVKSGNKNLSQLGINNAKIFQAGKSLGLPDQAPFDRILVSATSLTMPQSLLDQMHDGSIMVLPIGRSLVRVLKNPQGFIATEYPGFVFVPLINSSGG